MLERDDLTEMVFRVFANSIVSRRKQKVVVVPADFRKNEENEKSRRVISEFIFQKPRRGIVSMQRKTDGGAEIITLEPFHDACTSYCAISTIC